MKEFLPRQAEQQISKLVNKYPAVVVVGPRQVGKTSLVKHIARQLEKNTIYLDLELPADLAKLTDPAMYLNTVQGSTVIIDEVQREPRLFPILRSLIDADRQPGRFILLGSASPELIRDTSESLAGRVSYFELPTFTLDEAKQATDLHTHWLRGGFPESLLAQNDEDSFNWRIDFIRSYLERDLPLLGLSADPVLIRRLWTMVAHLNGQLLNRESIARSLGITSPTVGRYLDFLEAAYLIRQLQPYHVDIKKRLVKSPKLFVRDTGLLHALLNIGKYDDLLGHPAKGASWESYILQEIAAKAPPRTELFFYRTAKGVEANLVLAPGGIAETLVEIKLTTAPKISRSLLSSMEDLGTKKHFIVCPVEEAYPIGEGVEVLAPGELERLWG